MKNIASGLVPHFSQLLAQREVELRSALHDSDRLADDAEDAVRGEVVDFKDIAAEQTNSQLEGVKADHAANELAQVMAARRRLGENSFGSCLACGEAIDLRRLEAMPATPYCAACQTLHEQERRKSVHR
jgi:DnaK suppressor protein